MSSRGTQKDFNLELIRSCLFSHPTLRIADAARETRLSIPTATALLARLEKQGEALLCGMEESTGGRPAAAYRVNPDYAAYLLIRTKMQNIFFQVHNYLGECMESGEILGCESVKEALDELVVSVNGRYPHLAALYLGIAGIVKDNCITLDMGCPELNGMDIAAHFREKFDMTAFAENDMNLTAYGCWADKENPFDTLVCLYLQLNSGFSIGTVVKGSIWHGKSGLAGEVHLIREDVSELAETNPEEFCSIIVNMYSVTIDPDQIIIFPQAGYPQIDLDSVRAKCMQSIPSLPQIRVAYDMNKVYWRGLETALRKKIGLHKI